MLPLMRTSFLISAPASSSLGRDLEPAATIRSSSARNELRSLEALRCSKMTPAISCWPCSSCSTCNSNGMEGWLFPDHLDCCTLDAPGVLRHQAWMYAVRKKLDGGSALLQCSEMIPAIWCWHCSTCSSNEMVHLLAAFWMPLGCSDSRHGCTLRGEAGMKEVCSCSAQMRPQQSEAGLAALAAPATAM